MSPSSIYPMNDDKAFDKCFTKRFKFLIVNYIDVSMDGFSVERGTEQLDITDCLESSAGDSTMGRPSALRKGPTTGYKRLRAAKRLEAVNADLQAFKRKDGASTGSHEKTIMDTRKI